MLSTARKNSGPQHDPHQTVPQVFPRGHVVGADLCALLLPDRERPGGWREEGRVTVPLSADLAVRGRLVYWQREAQRQKARAELWKVRTMAARRAANGEVSRLTRELVELRRRLDQIQKAAR